MCLVTVVWLPLAATISMVPPLVRICLLKVSVRNKVSAPHRHSALSKVNVLSKASAHSRVNVLRDNVRHKASASSLPVVK
jgi:hypothetical protein